MAKKNPSFSQAKEKKKNAASQDSPTAVVLRLVFPHFCFLFCKATTIPHHNVVNIKQSNNHIYLLVHIHNNHIYLLVHIHENFAASGDTKPRSVSSTTSLSTRCSSFGPHKAGSNFILIKLTHH
ncbi:hypothetical protein YC2023_049684 [Brassica napus]